MFSKDAAEGSAAANSVQAAAAALLSTAQALPLSSCDGQALANTLWALATLGQRPPLVWLNRVLQHAEAAAARGFLSAQGVSMTLWALAALAVVPQASCLSALLAAAQQHLRHMTPQGFSNVLWALAVLERPPSKDWLAGFWTASRTLLPQMTAQALVNCMWAAARLKLQPPQEWVGDVAGLLLQQGVGSLTRQGLSNTVWALSHISITCRTAHELLQSCLEEAAQVLQQQWSQQLLLQQQEQEQGQKRRKRRWQQQQALTCSRLWCSRQAAHRSRMGLSVQQSAVPLNQQLATDSAALPSSQPALYQVRCPVLVCLRPQSSLALCSLVLQLRPQQHRHLAGMLLCSVSSRRGLLGCCCQGCVETAAVALQALAAAQG